MKICVYGAASNNIAPIYVEKTEVLGRLLADNNISLVFGGGGGGMMGAAARGAHERCGEIIAVVPRFFNVDGILFDHSTKTIYTDTMRERKKTMEDLSDAFIVTPGGIGTLDEFFEILTLKSLDRHQKPIGILNINHFYDGMLELLNRAVDGGFISASAINMLIVEEDPTKLLNAIVSECEKSQDTE